MSYRDDDAHSRSRGIDGRRTNDLDGDNAKNLGEKKQTQLFFIPLTNLLAFISSFEHLMLH